MNPITKIGDATIIGDLTTPEVSTFLDSEIDLIWATTMRAPGGKEKKGKKSKTSWIKYKARLGNFIEHGLSEHPVKKEIDGLSFVYNRAKEFPGTCEIGGIRYPLAYRTANTAEAITALVIDADEGDTLDRVIAALKPLGVLCVGFTSYSHTTKAGPGEDRFRIVVFLKEAFELPESGEERRQALNVWKRKYVGFCESIGVTTFDRTGMDLSRLQRPPRRPSEDAEFKHYIIAGTGLDLDTVEDGDPTKYGKKEVARRSGGLAPVEDEGGDAILSDGFDVRAWFNDVGSACMFGDVLDMIGWETRTGDGAEREIMCPNDAAHSNPGDPDDTACWIKEDTDEGFRIHCLHDHCSAAGVHTWDMVRLIDKAIADVQIGLPDGYESFSDVLCDGTFFPDEIEGEPVELSKYDYGVPEPAPEIETISTKGKVKRLFKRLSDPSDKELAALYAGVIRGGNKPDIVAQLDALVREHGQRNGNDVQRLRKQGRELLDEWKAAHAAEKQSARSELIRESLDREDIAHSSLDPTGPLGDTMEEAIATLGKRYAVLDMAGKFRIARKPDLDAFTSETQDPTMIFYTKQDFIDLHSDRQVREGKEETNPAKAFLDHQTRKSGLVFAPPPVVASPTAFNIYQGRWFEAEEGEWATIRDFIFQIVCRGDQKKYNFLELWMAHMVQRPGELPGTAVIVRGEGGTGKGTFGDILKKLTFPHCKQLEKESHVMSNFAGEHLSKCILAVVTEAVFGASPKVASELKAMVSSTTMQVEAKGMNVVTAPSYLRLYFDSNDEVPILIEDNGSDRRWFVMEISEDVKQDKDYFLKLRSAMNGDEMAGFLHHLERYDPADAGFTWSDVMKAPETEERRVMREKSRSEPMQRLIDVLGDGAVDLRVTGEIETFTADAKGLRLPVAPFREFLREGSRFRNRLDIVEMFERLHPGVALGDGQGACGLLKNTRWILFPPEVLGTPVPETDVSEAAGS
ncbi:primase-helicase family protein [Roseovarius sp. THAF27]|uniref:primase-helicase family protein n=1 Tax=Roseovarius sp. THAF27 TaxID=2587850 RepID=UPI001C12A2CD|nr:DUF5906 domain-containing protein [Roseovarius sp. THAF27]